MGGAYITFGEKQRYMQNFGGESWEKETIWKTQTWMGG